MKEDILEKEVRTSLYKIRAILQSISCEALGRETDEDISISALADAALDYVKQAVDGIECVTLGRGGAM